MLVWEKMRRELGLGERSDREGTRERTRGKARCAHLASLAVRGRSATAGGRGSACPRAGFALAGTGNGPGAVASAQTQRWVSDRSAGIMISYGYQFRGAARPWRPVRI